MYRCDVLYATIFQGRPLRKTDGLSSNPSSYTPLQPSSRGPRERDSTIMTRADHSAFFNPSTEMTHSVKLVDKNWHFEDRGVDVRNCYIPGSSQFRKQQGWVDCG